MLNMQALVDGMSAQWQRERAATQLTLGALIAALEKMRGCALALPLRAHPVNQCLHIQHS